MQIENRMKNEGPQQRSVLVLEDDPQWQTIVRQLLRKVDAGINVRCVPTSARAVELLNEGAHYDLIVADQFLDGQTTGLDFYRHCRSLHNSTAFVMLSGLGNDEFRDLVAKDVESPLFVSKSSSLDMFSTLVRAEMRFETTADVSAPAIIAEVTPTDVRTESAFLTLLFTSALALTVSHTHFTQAPAAAGSAGDLATRMQAMHQTPAAAQKYQTLMGHGHESLVTPLPKASRPSLIMNPRLKTDMKRILSRADQITKKVSKTE